MKSCPPDKILNPATNRCVSKTGAIGKKLIGVVKKKVITTTNDCPPDKILNPATNRCVSKTGAIGKKLMGLIKLASPMKPNKSDRAKVESLYGRPNKNKLSVLMKNTFKLYPIDHSLDKTQIRKFIDACDPEVKKIAQKLINNTDHISFEKFLTRMNTCIYHLISIVKVDRPVFVYLGVDLKEVKNKSNYWLYLYVKEFIRYITNNKKVILITEINNPLLKKDDVIVLIDDCIYSGMQMGDTIYNIKNTISNDYYLLVPYMSTKSIEVIKNNFAANSKLSTSKLIITPHHYNLKLSNDILNENEIDIIGKYYINYYASFRGKYLIYFDHKLADTVSTITHFYLGIVPSKENIKSFEKAKEINQDYYKKGDLEKALKFNSYDYLKIIPIIKNCSHYTKKIEVMSPKCPAPPYKESFKEFINLIKKHKKPKSFSNEKKKNDNRKVKSF
jgi:hypothetical protein